MPPPPYTGDLELPQPLSIKASLILCLQMVPISHLHSNCTVLQYQAPLSSHPQPSQCRQSLLISLPLICSQVGEGIRPQPRVNLTSLPLTVSGPWGCSEVGKKTELRRMEGVDGVWRPSNLIPISAFFQVELTF